MRSQQLLSDDFQAAELRHSWNVCVRIAGLAGSLTSLSAAPHQHLQLMFAAKVLVVVVTDLGFIERW